MAKTKEERLQDIHSFALRAFNRIMDSSMYERAQALEDRRFYSIAGAQWDGNLGQQFANKPKFEVNKVHLSVFRIINEYRNNRITVDFVSKEGKEYDKLADTCDGLYRADEQDSSAEEAYDNAFEEGVGGGMGAWRLTTEYEDDEDDEDEKQRIKMEPIYDADTSVFFDADSKKYDKSDADHCFVLTSMTVDRYIEEYDDDPASWPKDMFDDSFNWYEPESNIVYVAEFYKVEHKSYGVQTWVGISGDEEKHYDKDLKDDPSLEETLISRGFKYDRTKKVKKRKVHKYIMSGSKVIEDCGYIAGSEIPIVPFYGKRWFVDNIERFMGHVRLAKDAQRLANMLRSKLAEFSAKSSDEKPIFTPEQIGQFGEMWARDNIDDNPYLLINPIKDINGNEMPAGPLAYTKPTIVPPALAALLQITEQDMQDLLGNQQAAEEITSNISGKAVELIQNRLDMQSYIYMSNMAKSVKRSGQIWLSMARDVLVEEDRKMKTIGKSGENGNVELNKLIVNDDGETEYENDISEAKFDLAVDVGPTSSSRRSATVRALQAQSAISTDPETKAVLDSVIMMNMEGEGISEIREYFRQKLIRMGVIKPNDEEIQQLQAEKASAQPTAQDVYLQKAAEEAEAKAKKANADTIYAIARAEQTNAETEKTKAETIETLSSVDRESMKASVQMASNLADMQQTATTPPETE